jgi:asparagine synthase (glutamine-hydrolysing)
MSAFMAVVRIDGAPVGDTIRTRWTTRAGDWRWGVQTDGSTIVGHTIDSPRTTLTRMGDWLVVGTARLDNRSDIAAWIGVPLDRSDLELIGAAIASRGRACIHDILGDFALVAHNSSTRQVIAARDALGVKSLFVRERPGEIAFSSHAASLADGEHFDLEYIAEFILNGFDRGHRSPYAGIRAIPPGHLLTLDHGKATVAAYWSAAEFQPAETAGLGDSVLQFGELLDRAIISNLSDTDDNWSQLSGGVDSSTLTCRAEALRREGRVSNGITGVLTMEDTLDTELPWARLVSEQWSLRHEAVTDHWLWQDDGEQPPANDAPDPIYPFWARNRACAAAVKSVGGSVLWSGLGPDHFLAGNLYFFADWVAKGQVLTAARELWRWSGIGKKPFLSFAVENALTPLLPTGVRRLATPRWARVYDWITPAFSRRFDLPQRTHWGRSLTVPAGRKYAGGIENDMTHIPACMERGVFEDGLEMRYPFLYRPLVEFSLRLPRELRTQPGARKWVMREAMRGTLPEKIRTRRGKGAISGRTRWSLHREAATIEDLLREPILADLGCIEPQALRKAVRDSLEGDDKILFAAVRTLSLETWLRVITGRWKSTRPSVAAEEFPALV